MSARWGERTRLKESVIVGILLCDVKQFESGGFFPFEGINCVGGRWLLSLADRAKDYDSRAFVKETTSGGKKGA